MQSSCLRSTFLRVLNILQIKNEGTNFWGQPILEKVWIIWFRFLYLTFKSFKNLNSSSFIRFQYILYDSVGILSDFSNFFKLKREDLIFWGNQFCRKSELFGPPFSVSMTKVSCTEVLCDSGVPFSKFWNFYKLKIGDQKSR